MSYDECRHGWALIGIPACPKCLDVQGKVAHLVRLERIRQDRKWGDQSGNSDFVWFTVLTEEVGELAEAILKKNFEHGDTLEHQKEELIQTLAVGTAWIEAILEWETANGN